MRDFNREQKECRDLGARAYREGFGDQPSRKFVPYFKLVGFSDEEIAALKAAYQEGWRDAQFKDRPYDWERMMSQ